MLVRLDPIQPVGIRIAVDICRRERRRAVGPHHRLRAGVCRSDRYRKGMAAVIRHRCIRHLGNDIAFASAIGDLVAVERQPAYRDRIVCLDRRNRVYAVHCGQRLLRSSIRHDLYLYVRRAVRRVQLDRELIRLPESDVFHALRHRHQPIAVFAGFLLDAVCLFHAHHDVFGSVHLDAVNAAVRRDSHAVHLNDVRHVRASILRADRKRQRAAMPHGKGVVRIQRIDTADGFGAIDRYPMAGRNVHHRIVHIEIVVELQR